MASYEKLHDSELEAGRTMDQHNDVVVVDDKGRSDEPFSSDDSNRRSMSPLKRAFAVVFIFAFIGFSLLRGVALVSVHCISSKYSQLGNQPELMEDEAFMEALRSISPEEYCKLYAEYCPDKTEPAMDTWDKVEAIDEVTVELSDAEPTIKASLDKRQDTGGNGTLSEVPPTSIPSSTSSEPTSNPPTSDIDTSSTTEAPPPPVTTSSTEPPSPPSTTTTTSTEDDDDETSTTSQPPTSEPTTTSSVESTSTTSERPTSADEDETSSTPQSSSSRRTVTSGSITTTSAERITYTSTLADGGATVITSTTWVEFVPEETAQSENDPNLQGSASGWKRSTYLQVIMGVLVGGILMI